MYLTSLFKDKAPITYTYTKRCLNTPLFPDADCERETLDVYSVENGNLFASRPIGWKGHVLLNGSVDINVRAQKQYYIDHIILRQTEYSNIGSVEIFTDREGDWCKIGGYKMPNQHRITEREIYVPVGAYCENVTVRLSGAYVAMGLENLEIFAAADMENAIYPMPKYVSMQDSVLSFDNVKTVSVDDETARPAAEYLIELVKEKFGKTWTIAENGDVRFSLFDAKNDAYEIQTTEKDCQITAGNKRAFFYAAYTLMQTMKKEGIQQGQIKDEPMMDMRGFHLALPSRKDTPFFKKLVKELLVPLRYNMIFLQISGAMRYDKYPEINEKWIESCERYEKGEWPQPAHYGFISRDILEKTEVAELCAYIRSFGLEIIPEIQSLSHSQYISTAYPFLVEIENKKASDVDLYEADERPAEFYYHNLCPSHPQYYDYVLGVAEEVLDVVKPERFAHMGHDEVYILGKCDKCKERGATAVYVEEVTRLNEFLKSKNLTMMIWSDMLQNETYSVPDAIHQVPKDIIMLDFTWYFHPEKDIEDRLLEAGYQVMMGNMYSSHYTRYNTRSRKPGIIGAEVSTWVPCNERSYAYEGKLYDLVYSANTMWSEAYNAEYRLTYGEIVKPIIWEMRKRIGGIVEGEKTELNLGEGAHREYIPSELVGKIPYAKTLLLSMKKPQAEIPVNDTIKGVRLVHGTDLSVERVMWKPAQKIGKYTLVYEDGTTYTDTMEYGENIYKYAHTYGTPIPSFLFRHEGYTGTYSSKAICGKDKDGNDYTLLEYPINNPYSEKKVTKILVKHNQNTDANILVFAAYKVK